MRRKRRNPNTPYIIAIVVLSAVLLALLLVGDKIINGLSAQDSQPSQTTTVPQSSASASSAVPDTVAPVISGVKDLETYTDSTVAYKRGVTVTDNLDPTPILDIDNSQVNMGLPGVYPVTYTATDASGNKTSVTINLTVKIKPANFVEPEVIYERVDALLAQFIRDDMTDREKAEAIYVWTRRGGHIGPGHFNYSGSTSRHDD